MSEKDKKARKMVKDHTGMKIKGRSLEEVMIEAQEREKYLQKGATLEVAKKKVITNRKGVNWMDRIPGETQEEYARRLKAKEELTAGNKMTNNEAKMAIDAGFTLD